MGSGVPTGPRGGTHRARGSNIPTPQYLCPHVGGTETHRAHYFLIYGTMEHRFGRRLCHFFLPPLWDNGTQFQDKFITLYCSTMHSDLKMRDFFGYFPGTLRLGF